MNFLVEIDNNAEMGDALELEKRKIEEKCSPIPSKLSLRNQCRVSSVSTGFFSLSMMSIIRLIKSSCFFVSGRSAFMQQHFLLSRWYVILQHPGVRCE